MFKVLIEKKHIFRLPKPITLLKIIRFVSDMTFYSSYELYIDILNFENYKFS